MQCKGWLVLLQCPREPSRNNFYSRNVLLFVLLLSLMSVVLSACSQGEAMPNPPEIRYGEDLCAECNMIISEPRYAAGYAYEISAGRYESRAFDDIGDLLAYHAKHPEQKVVAWYVHDYATEAWLDATIAYYVVSDQSHSPMGHGITAHATRAAANQFGQERAALVLAWHELQAQASDMGQHASHH